MFETIVVSLYSHDCTLQVNTSHHNDRSMCTAKSGYKPRRGQSVNCASCTTFETIVVSLYSHDCTLQVYDKGMCTATKWLLTKVWSVSCVDQLYNIESIVVSSYVIT